MSHHFTKKIWGNVVHEPNSGFPGQLAHVRFYLHGLPRVVLLCRIFGHDPVVDGSEGYSGPEHTHAPSLWVCCRRCGVRPLPQGSLDPDLWGRGDHYDGPVSPHLASSEAELFKAFKQLKDEQFYPPGSWPSRPDGECGGELIVGRTGLGAIGWEVKVGNPGSDTTLAAAVHLGPLGSLFLHTKKFGQWLQRWLNPHARESRVTSFEIRTSGIEWRIWSKRDSGSRYGEAREPWWRNGRISFELLDWLLGPKQYSYTDVRGGVMRLVLMPEADYLVEMTLQRQTFGRRIGRKKRSWIVAWKAVGEGIPERPHRGGIVRAAVAVTASNVEEGTWPAEAAAAIAMKVTRGRCARGWEPSGKVPIRENA